MISRIYKDTFRKLFRAKGRFVALFGIIAISSGFFAGLKVTSPNFKESAELYYQDTRLMDLHLLSNYGFCQAEVDALAQEPDVLDLYAGYSETAYLQVNAATANPIVQVYSLPEGAATDTAINQPILTAGRYPENAEECLMEVNTPESVQIGDTITIDIDDPDTSILEQTTFTVVGEVDWSMFVNYERGTTTIGNGSIDCFLMVLPDAFAPDVYTDIFLRLVDTQGMNSFTDTYRTLTRQKGDLLVERCGELSKSRGEQLIAEATDAMTDARTELDDGWAEYEDGRQTFETEIADAEALLADAKQQLDAGLVEWQDGNTKYESGLAEYEQSKATLDERKATLEAQEALANNAIAEIDGKQQYLTRVEQIVGGYRGSTLVQPYPTEIQTLIEQAAAYDSDAFSLSGSLSDFFEAPVDSAEKLRLESTIVFYVHNCSATLTDELAELERSAQDLTIHRNTLNNAYAELSNAKAYLDSSKEQLDTAKAELDQAQSEYDTGVAELETRRTDGLAELADAKAELEQAEADYTAALAEIKTLPDGIEWYALDRSDNPGWSSYGEDADRVDAVAAVFPIFFLLVAGLVCLTTMTRMVEEQRTEIGTLKALGYSTGQISVQFLIYAALASVLGVVVGTLIGFQLFPKVIFLCYKTMYDFPYVNCPFHWDYALICLAAALACTGLTSMIACQAELREVPAQLMRPKPPKQGKRILLERWNRVWSKLSFHTKVTIRNFCRYKSRVLMTMIGICGCTALLLAGFGLNRSISAIDDLQFKEIYHYDCIAFYDENAENPDALLDLVNQTSEVTAFQQALLKSDTIRANDNAYEITLTVASKPDAFSHHVTLRERKSHDPIPLTDDGIVINEKLAKLLSVQVGNTVELAGAYKPVTITAITENYTMNHAYLTPACYTDLFGALNYNSIYLNFVDGTDEDNMATHLLQNDDLLTLQFLSKSGGSFRQLVNSMQYIVLLIIVCSGLLAFVVLYNLANINITERMRELATIKVLGFYDGEVAAYIYRENILSSFLGMLCGLVTGIFFFRFVLAIAEVDAVMFSPDLPWYCFLYAALLTMFFTVLVNLLLFFKLRHIDMAGSLKAIE